MKRMTAIVLCLLLACTASASVPGLIPYQGRLTDAANVPLTGTYSMQFRIYDAAAGGTVLWSETQPVTVTDGLYSVNLGDVNVLNDTVFATKIRYLGVTVGSDPELSPRTMLLSVPYAFRASTVDGARGGTIISKLAVGVTNTNPGQSSFVTGENCTANGNLSTVGGGANNQADGPYNTICGGQFNYTSGRASTVLGGASNYVSGDYSMAGGHYANAVNNNCFVWNSDSTIPLYSSGNNQFLINATGGVGINNSSPTVALDVSGAIRGYALTTNGVEGHSESFIASGVYGENLYSGYGVAGRSTGAGSAIYGDNLNTSGYAGRFNGRLYVSGNATIGGNLVVSGSVTKGGGSFRIDHPLDPYNKYLYHSFVESPDMMDIYDGNVVTDSTGYATITMPAWFQALNRDFRYQLTVIGDGTWARARVVKEIEENQFRIQTDLPNIKVSWQVTGIRQDSWANEHRIPVEEDKPEAERGTLSGIEMSATGK